MATFPFTLYSTNRKPIWPLVHTGIEWTGAWLFKYEHMGHTNKTLWLFMHFYILYIYMLIFGIFRHTKREYFRCAFLFPLSKMSLGCKDSIAVLMTYITQTKVSLWCLQNMLYASFRVLFLFEDDLLLAFFELRMCKCGVCKYLYINTQGVTFEKEGWCWRPQSCKPIP